MSSYSQAVTIQGILRENANSEIAEYRKMQHKIKQELNIDISIESLKHMIYLYREIMKIR